ncbi:hypothetical protein K7887_18445 [Sutcliffiella horikoshii]|uniref:hypothetical protein n=1 Tax=Sutcliffiella TaxID=2837511 RepID=UPI001CC0A207|nr:hypothetical protein [Sutcliffiella horikoshii]UAL46822.1 hypothetical protein K7887_18445 [Sutcliffiella horikoshii]
MLKNQKEERLEAINKLIQFISERGRRFFETRGNLAFMKMKNGRIYFVDDYTQREIPVIKSYYDWKGFSHGGTLRALVLDFAEYVRTGNYTNGNNGYGGLYCRHWGHSEVVQQEIIDYAKQVGFLKN